MGVEVIRKAPPVSVEPILSVSLEGPSGRKVIIRPNSSDPKGTTGKRTVEVHSAFGLEAKWTSMLGDLRSFGEALIAIADGK